MSIGPSIEAISHRNLKSGPDVWTGAEEPSRFASRRLGRAPRFRTLLARVARVQHLGSNEGRRMRGITLKWS